MEEIQLTPEKSFQIKLSSDKNNYSFDFNLNNVNNDFEITANQINSIHKSYSNRYSFEEIRENKYFLQFDNLDEIFDEIKDRIEKNKIIIKENENKLILNVPLHDNQEIIFELNPIIKNTKDRLNELTDLIMKLNTEINNIRKEEIANLNNKNKQFNEENKQIKNEINYMKDKEAQLINSYKYIINYVNYSKNENTHLKNDINQLKNEVNQLKNDNIQLKNYINQINKENIMIKNEVNRLGDDNIQLINNETQLRNENAQLRKEVNELHEKLNILWKEKIYINYLDSKILNEKEKYNKALKNWINPTRKIKADLLYRLSENGDITSTFHELCDNKGPTLTLFHVNDGNIVGIYTPLSWDSASKGFSKNDMDTFIFNLNKNQKYTKLKSDCSIYCFNKYGPYTADFGCGKNSMKSIIHNANYINRFYDKGSEILPSNNIEKEYDLIETEVYKIIIE